MYGTFLFIITMLIVGPAEFSRGGATAQREFEHAVAPLRRCVSNLPQSRDLSVEVFQVLDLPLSIHEASLVKSYKNLFVLKLAVGNSSDLKLIGLRYSLITIDSKNQLQPLVNRTEGFSLAPYDTKTLTFKAPINFKPKDGERLVLMVEQLVSRESIWEVVKAKDALEAYAKGDFSVMPVVMRVSNSVDAPPGEPRPVIRRN